MLCAFWRFVKVRFSSVFLNSLCIWSTFVNHGILSYIDKLLHKWTWYHEMLTSPPEAVENCSLFQQLFFSSHAWTFSLAVLSIVNHGLKTNEHVRSMGTNSTVHSDKRSSSIPTCSATQDNTKVLSSWRCDRMSASSRFRRWSSNSLNEWSTTTEFNRDSNFLVLASCRCLRVRRKLYQHPQARAHKFLWLCFADFQWTEHWRITFVLRFSRHDTSAMTWVVWAAQFLRIRYQRDCYSSPIRRISIIFISPTTGTDRESTHWHHSQPFHTKHCHLKRSHLIWSHLIRHWSITITIYRGNHQHRYLKYQRSAYRYQRKQCSKVGTIHHRKGSILINTNSGMIRFDCRWLSDYDTGCIDVHCGLLYTDRLIAIYIYNGQSHIHGNVWVTV